jgi:hypothetical protein
MMKVKNICKGINPDGTKCDNHSLRNSYYCYGHQAQATETDILKMEKKRLKEVLLMFTVIIVLIVVCVLTDFR